MRKSLALLLFCLMFSFRLTWAITGEVISSFPTPGSCPTGLCYDGKYLWLADRKTDSLYQVDPQNGKIVFAIPSPGFRPDGLAWDGRNLWNLDLEENLIFQLDSKTGLALKTIFAPTSSPKGLAWDGKYLWVADDLTRQINQISIDDGTTIVTIPSPATSPQGLCYDGKYLWVADRLSDMIFMITPEKGDVILAFPSPNAYARGLAWDGKYLWNVDYQSDSVYKIKIGDDQIFSRKDEKNQSLEYTYEFRNYGPGEIKGLDIYLAIPEDLNNQKLLTPVEFAPEPNDILTDKWGQKVAHFKFQNLASTKFVRCVMKASAKLYKTDYFIFPEKVGKLQDIPKEIKNKYLVDDDKYSIRHPFIQKSAKEAVGDEKNPYWIARKIYNYVLSKMQYELSGGWNIAPTVLMRGTGSCSEYSFVYIALCRACGLPARYVGSVAIRGDDASLDDVFHRWCEVYLPNYGWIPVDPSGGDSPMPWDQGRCFGHLANRYLITTVSGGGSEYLGWSYNSSEKWTSLGQCKIYTENIGEWSPLSQSEVSKMEDLGSGKACQPKK